jgi:hypothetical protein
MENDRDTIEEAYGDALRNLFNVLLDAFVGAPQDQKAQNSAAQTVQRRFGGSPEGARRSVGASLVTTLMTIQLARAACQIT